MRKPIVPDPRGDLLDVEARAAQVTPNYLEAVRAFVPFSGFIAAHHSGRLLIESLPEPSQLPGVVQSHLMHTDLSWYLDRWNRFRYLLLLQTSESERDKYVNHVEAHKEFVGIMYQTDQISHFLRLSPQFILPWFESEQGPLAFVKDHAVPFARPANLQFKNKSKLNYH